MDLPELLYGKRAVAVLQLRFASEVLWNALLGGLVAMHLAGVSGLLAHVRT